MPSVNSTLDFDSASALTHTIPFNNVGGNFLILGFTNLSTSGDTVVSIAYAGSPATKVGHQGALNGRTANMWRLNNPATGTNNLVITVSAAIRLVGNVQTYTSVDLTNPIDATASGQVNSGTAFDMPITTVANNCGLYATAYINRNVSSYGTNTTSVYYVAATHQTTRSTAAVTPAGSTSLSFTMATAEVGAAYYIVSLKPAATPRRLMMMGVGT